MAFTDQGAYLDTSERVHIGGTGDPVVSLKVTGQIYATDNITAYYFITLPLFFFNKLILGTILQIQ